MADENAAATSDELALATLKADLNRSGNFPADDSYLLTLLSAARHWLALQGVRDDASPTYLLILAARAAWMYRKRVTGEAEPSFLRRMVYDFKLSRGADV